MAASSTSPTLVDRVQWLKSLAGRHLGSSVSLARRLGGRDPRRLEVVDCGCGLNDTVVSRQVLRLPWSRLVGVEGCAAVVELARRRPSRAARRELLCIPLAELPRQYRWQKAFDVAFCLDVLEHLPKGEALQFLRELEVIVRRRIVLWLPLGEYRVDADPHGRGNELERHRSFWLAADVAALGYAVEVLPRFHRARYDALWGIKDLGG